MRLRCSATVLESVSTGSVACVEMDEANDEMAYEPLVERDSIGSVACLAIDETPRTGGIDRVVVGDTGSVPCVANDDILRADGEGDSGTVP